MSEPSGPSPEHEALCEFLGYQREALISRLDGLSEAQARATPTASALSLLGIVRHSAIWERRWFQVIVAGRRLPGEWPEVSEPNDTTFVVGEGDTIASVVGRYRAEIGESDRILRAADLDAVCARADLVEETVRWVALHLVEETARHAGHADIIRETIDGTTGR
ncbi:MAG: DinB family protein [Actinomycetota bacterium]